MDAVFAVFAVATGALLMSWSVFLYEEEERLISDALASWWIRIDDVAVSATARNRLLIRDVASALIHWLDDVFGEQLVSLRALEVSLRLSSSSIAAFVTLVALSDPNPTRANPIIVLVCFPVSYFLFSVAVAHTRRYRLTVVSFAIAGLVLASVILAITTSPTPLRALSLPAGFVFGVSCDFLVIVLIRRLVISAVAHVTILSAIAIAIGSALLGTAMLCSPVIFFYDSGYEMNALLAFGVLAGLTNLYAGVLAVGFVAVNSMFLLQKAIWPVIERPLYAIQRFNLFQKRRALLYCGAVLMAVGFPAILDALLRVLDRF